MIELPKVYPITDTRMSGLSHLEQAREMIAGGARLIQIRDKNASSSDLYEAATAVCELAAKQGVTVVINDRVDIALAVGAGGVHLGQDDLPPEEARKLLGPRAVIGYSTHSVEQAKHAADLPVDYIAIGPVFPTVTKENPDPEVGLDGVRAVKKMIGNIPLVAIGGISLDNFSEVLESGADSAAVVGGILGEPSSIPDTVSKFLSLAAPYV